MSLGRLLTSLAVAALGGCFLKVAPPESPASSSREFFPLHPGTLWIYEVRDYQGHVDLKRVLVRGSLHLNSRDADGVVVEESGGAGEELVFDVSWHPVAYYRRGEFLYKFSGLGYVGAELREFRLGQGEEKVLPADPVSHPQWESDFEVFHLDGEYGYGLRAVSTVHPGRETVRVRAGTFRNCLRVETQTVGGSVPRRPAEEDVVFRYTDWYSAGIGLVKSVVESPGAARPLNTMELVSFRDGGSRD